MVLALPLSSSFADTPTSHSSLDFLLAVNSHRRPTMSQQQQPLLHSDPYFFTPRQLAEHLLLTYPPDYKVSPAQLKHSVILANDVSGKVFLCAIPGPSELELILGVGTLGARVWLWDEVRKMRRMSAGYHSWERQKEAEDKEEQKRGLGVVSYLAPPPLVVVGGDTKRKRDVGNSPAGPNAKRQAPASRWAAVRTATASFPAPSPSLSPAPTPIPDGSVTGSLSSEIFVLRRSLEDEDASFAPSSRCVSTTSPALETDILDSASETSCTPRPTGRSKKHVGDRLTTTPRPLRPRSYNQQNLPTLELVHILDPENLDVSEINIILRAIREIPVNDIYGEVIRAARVTAGDIDGGLSPSILAIKEGKETVDFVREIAAVYASWILSKPYPPKSLEPGDVERMANFESFLQFEVQLLNLLIPYESRRRSTSYHTASTSTPNTQTPTPTPTPASSTWTPTPTPSRALAPGSKSDLVVSDLSPPAPTEHDRCPEGWSLKQRKWGEAVVKKYRGTHKSWINLKPKPTK